MSICCLLDKDISCQSLAPKQSVLRWSTHICCMRQWKNQENVLILKISAYSEVRIILFKVQIWKHISSCLFLKDIRPIDFLLANWEQLRQIWVEGRTLWAPHLESQEEVLRRLILSSQIKDNCSHREMNFKILSSADNFKLGTKASKWVL